MIILTKRGAPIDREDTDAAVGLNLQDAVDVWRDNYPLPEEGFDMYGLTDPKFVRFIDGEPTILPDPIVVG